MRVKNYLPLGNFLANDAKVAARPWIRFQEAAARACARDVL